MATSSKGDESDRLPISPLEIESSLTSDDLLCTQMIGNLRCTNNIDGAKNCAGASDTLCGSCRSKKTKCQRFMEILKSENTQQSIQVLLKFALQIYSMLIGSLLIIFTPQLCDKNVEGKTPHACTIKENFEIDYPFYLAGLIFNFLSVASFFTMYLLELSREDMLIKYMDVNVDVNNDGPDVLNRMIVLHTDEYLSLKKVCTWYKRVLRLSALLFVVNTVCSFIIVVTGDYSLGTQTTSTFVTNCLFIVLKLIDVSGTVSAAKNVYFSAYLMTKLQYNDADPSCIMRYLKEHPEKENGHDLKVLQSRLKTKDSSKKSIIVGSSNVKPPSGASSKASAKAIAKN